MGNVRRR